MSRRVVIKQRNEQILDELIDQYGNYKEEEKIIKAQLDEKGKDIKQAFVDYNLDSVDTGEYVATVSKSQRETLNELQAIEILREQVPTEIFKQLVKKKEYLDEEAVESLAFDKKFDPSILNPAVELSPVSYTLRIKKSKKR